MEGDKSPLVNNSTVKARAEDLLAQVVPRKDWYRTPHVLIVSKACQPTNISFLSCCFFSFPTLLGITCLYAYSYLCTAMGL